MIIGLASCLFGFFLNLTVILANQGSMPSFGRLETEGIWIPKTNETTFNWLGDRFWGFSIGDFFLILGFILSMILHKR